MSSPHSRAVWMIPLLSLAALIPAPHASAKTARVYRAVADTAVSHAHPDHNYGKAKRLTVGPGARAYLRFKIKNVPGYKPSSVKLNVSGTSKKLKLWRAQNGWAEKKMTFKTRPSYERFYSGTGTISVAVTSKKKTSFASREARGTRNDPSLRVTYKKAVVASPSTQPSPTDPATGGGSFGDLPGWRNVFNDDFTTPTTAFPGPYASKWFAYPGWKDTSGKGTYDTGSITVHDGVMDSYIHTVAGKHFVTAPVPRLPGSTGSGTPSGQKYGRYSVRFKSDKLPGYKTAWLLWPDSGKWPADGEIDFPEADLDGVEKIKGFVHHQNGSSGSDQAAFSSDTPHGDGQWHVATTEWTANLVKFFLDGKLVGQTSERVPNTPMHWVLQTETNLHGDPISDSTAGHVLVDWVSVWAPDANAGQKPAPAPTSAPTTGTITVAAAGDFCGGGCGSVAQLMRSMNPDVVAGLGDFQYQNAGGNGAKNWQSVFGDLAGKTLPVFGSTHDTDDGSGSWEGSVVSYFNANGHPLVRGKLADHSRGYSGDIGAGWHVIGLNYNAQDNAFIDADLAGRAGQCVLALDHAPFMGSTTSEHPTSQGAGMLASLQAGGADVLLAGHQHFYTRDIGTSFQQFVVGTGGVGEYAITTKAGSTAAYSPGKRFGALKLVLSPGHWDAQFIDTAGVIVDSASGNCAD